MNLGIYKPGQGHWVRVMTAVLAALVTVTFALWMYGQMEVLADRLPKAAYRIGFESEHPGAFAVGDAVELTTRPDSNGVAAPVGTATVSFIDPGEKKLITVSNFQPTSPAGKLQLQANSAGLIRKTVEGAKPINIAKSGGVVGVAPVDPTLLAGGVATAVVILGALLSYWFVGLRPRTVEFLIATDFEMKKVNWSTPREIMGHTWVVIGACFFLAGILFVVDIGLKNGFSFIHLLP